MTDVVRATDRSGSIDASVGPARPPKFTEACGEFDELFVEGVSIHVERMNTRAFWIGIDRPGEPSIHINTGIAEGQWFFNVFEDAEGVTKDYCISRPACHRRHLPSSLADPKPR